MAKQDGIVPIKGSIGNLTFVRRKSGYGVQRKTSVDAKRIANDPAFARTRENGAEFGRAGVASKLIRGALRSVLQNVKDASITPRLIKELIKVIKSDTTNERGKRNVTDGNLALLEGFEFNESAPLSNSLHALYNASIERTTGLLKVDLAGMVPSNMVSVPSGVTHFRIVIAGVAIDFVNRVYVIDINATAEIPWDQNNTGPISLTATVTPNSTHPLLLALGLEYFQEVNGKMYPFTDKGFNSLSLVKVNDL